MARAGNRRSSLWIAALAFLVLGACADRVIIEVGTPLVAPPSDIADSSVAPPDEGGIDSSVPPDTSTDAGSAIDAAASLDAARVRPEQDILDSQIAFARSLAIGDLNGDGREDVAVGNVSESDQATVLVFLQTTTGELTSPPASYPFGSGPIRIADLNHDGRNDLVFTTLHGLGVALQKNDGTLGDPTFYPLNISEDSNDVITSDFDNDGRTDVVLIASQPVAASPGHAYLFVQSADGTLLTPSSFTTTGSGEGRAGDVNGDGLPDVLTLDTHGYKEPLQLSILPLDSPGVFGTAYTAELDGVVSDGVIAIGDVTDDGANDVVISIRGNQPDSHVLVLAQQGGKLAAPAKYPSGQIPASLGIADMNGDGRNDVIVAHQAWSQVGVYLQRSDGTMAEEIVLPLSYPGEGLLDVGDVNGDGRPDIVTVDQGVLILFYGE